MSTESKRIKLVVSYDGTDFCGWAAQSGQRTVQSTLTEAVRRVTGEEMELWGASRTDSGAHALGQVVHFDTCRPIPAERWTMILNRYLPMDLRVRSAEEVESTFSSRFDPQYRHYRYSILRDQSDPFAGRYAYATWHELDVPRMHEIAQSFLGRHDFRAFTEELDPSVENTVRELFRVDVSQAGDMISIDIHGTAFLRGMMRRISGFLFEIGRGHRPTSDLEILLGPDRERLQWSVVLPARGLCLREVVY